MKSNLENKKWWNYIQKDLQDLLLSSVFLLERTKDWKDTFEDYSFIVFPAAKAYEGFLKKMFLDLGFISQDEFYGKRFRVGKALNPSLEKKYRNESVYDRLVDFCSGKELADELWNTWRSCRNMVFHWFPNERNAVSYNEAKQRFQLIIDSIDKAFEDCRLNSNHQ